LTKLNFPNHFSIYIILHAYIQNKCIHIDGETVLNALKKVFYDPPIEPCDCEHQTDLLELPYQSDSHPRRTSAASSVSGNDIKIHTTVDFYMLCLLLTSASIYNLFIFPIYQSQFCRIIYIDTFLSFFFQNRYFLQPNVLSNIKWKPL